MLICPRIKQYKLRLTKWHFDTKNVKTQEMKAIVRKKVARQLEKNKDASFRLHGNDVPSAKIERFMERKGIPGDQEYPAMSPVAGMLVPNSNSLSP